MYKKICLNLFLVTLALAFFAKPTFAATFSLSPSKSSVGLGSTFTVQVRLDTQGVPVNAVDISMSYPKDLVDVAYVTQGSALSAAADKSFGNGGIHLALGGLNANTGQLTVANGNTLVATIGFKAKALGSAYVGMGPNSVAESSATSTNVITSITGGTFTIVPATPKPVSTTSTEPIISSIKETNIATNGATISWATDEKADSTVEYGFDVGKYFETLTTPKPDSSTVHTLTIANGALLPGNVIHYKITSKDAKGNANSSEDRKLQLVGYTLQVDLVDNQGNPVKNLKLTLYSDPVSGVSDNSGQITFNNMEAGKHVAVIQGSNFQRSSEVNVDASTDYAKVQVVKITVDVNGLTQLSNSQRPTLFGIDLRYFVGLAGLLALIILIGIVIYIKRRNDAVYSLFGQKNDVPPATPPSNLFPPPTPTQTSQPTVLRNDDKN